MSTLDERIQRGRDDGKAFTEFWESIQRTWQQGADACKREVDYQRGVALCDIQTEPDGKKRYKLARIVQFATEVEMLLRQQEGA